MEENVEAFRKRLKGLSTAQLKDLANKMEARLSILREQMIVLQEQLHNRPYKTPSDFDFGTIVPNDPN